MQAIAVGVKARLLRTRGSPWGTEAGRTYAGLEVGAAVGVKLAATSCGSPIPAPGTTWSVGHGL